MTTRLRRRRRPSTRRSPRSPPARGPSPAAPTSSSARARARRRCPTRSSRSTGSTSCAGSSEADGGLRLGALVTHAEIVADPAVRARFTALADASRDRRLARDPRAGHDRRQPDERVARDGDGRPARLLRRDGDAALGGAARARSPVAELFTGPGATVAEPDELLVAVDVPSPAADGTGSAYVRLEYRRQMEIAVVGATAVVTLDGRHGDDCARRDHGARADDPPRAGGRGRARRHARRRGGRRGRGARPRPRPPRRSPTCAPPSATGARWPR